MSKRPNPVKGRTMVPVNHELQFTREDMRQAIIRSRLDGKREYMETLGLTKLNAESTPSERWFANKGPDEFPELINKERGSLVMGSYTDDELANAVFLYGDMSLEEKHLSVMSGKPTSMAYLTAGKERIRWLSRHLESSLASEQKLVKDQANQINKGDVWVFLLKDHLERTVSVLSNDNAEQDKQDADFVNRAQKLLGKEYVVDRLKAMYEAAAIIIYEKWSGVPGYVDWIVNGNSDKQNKARLLTRNKHLHEIIKMVQP